MPGSSLADLVLLRHGIAEPRQAGQDHPERPLTAAGRQRTQLVMAVWCNGGCGWIVCSRVCTVGLCKRRNWLRRRGPLHSSRLMITFNLEVPLKRC